MAIKEQAPQRPRIGTAKTLALAGRIMTGGNPYTNQHTTARTYLKSWASPIVEKKKEKCWTFLLDDRRECGAGNLRLLSDIMCVPDIYTLYADDGSRDLQYETKTFRRAEDEYANLRARLKISYWHKNLGL